MAIISFLKYAEKAGYMKNGLATMPIKKIEKAYKENLRLQKVYYIIRDKQKKQIMLSSKDNSDKFRFSNIIW